MPQATMTASPHKAHTGDFAEEELRACVQKHRPGASLRFERIRTGKFNTSYYVWADEEELVLRIAPPRDSVFLFYERDMMHQEPLIHERLLRETTAPVAPILAFDESHTVIPRSFLIMRRLPGWPMTEGRYEDEDRILVQVGAYLAQVHSLTADRYGYLGPHAPMTPQPTWQDAFRVMWDNLIEDVASVGYYDKEERRFWKDLLEKRLSLFDRDVPACLLHMDVWAQNILTCRECVTGLVDWDRALWGDPEIEFAVLDYCGVSTPAFWAGYGRPRDLSRDGRVRNLFYLLYEVQKYIVIRHGRNHDPASASAYKRRAFSLAAKLMSAACH